MEQDHTATLVTVSSHAEAMMYWDGHSVVIRAEREGGKGITYVYVYPQLGKGVMYPNYDLRRESCLNGFTNVKQAKAWAVAKGFVYTVVGM